MMPAPKSPNTAVATAAAKAKRDAEKLARDILAARILLTTNGYFVKSADDLRELFASPISHTRSGDAAIPIGYLEGYLGVSLKPDPASTSDLLDNMHGAELEANMNALDENPCSGGRCPDPEAHAEGAHDI